MRKLAVVVLGGAIAVGGSFGARALASHATATVNPGPPPCAHVTAAVDGTPVNVDQTQCAPSGAPDLPPAPAPPSLPSPGDLPAPPSLPDLPAPPNVPTPPVAPPSLPGVSVPTPGASAAGVGSGCAFQSQRGSSPTEQTIATLPDGTQIYTSGDPTSLNGYMGGTGPHGTLEGSGSVSTAGVQGQLGGHSNDAPLDGYGNSDPSLCLNGNSLP